MRKKICILKDIEISEQNDSEAHVIPNALGGRLKHSGILCKKANEILNDKFDNPLIKNFSPIMSLLGGYRDRGKNQPIRMKDKSGKGEEYIYLLGEPLRPVKPTLDIEKSGQDEYTLYNIKARNTKDLRTLLGKVKKDHPHVDIEEIFQRAKANQTPADGMLGINLELGPRTLFPAVFCMASIYSTCNDMPMHPGFKEYVKRFNLEIPIMPPDTFYWLTADKWFKLEDGISHVLIYAGDANQKRAIFYSELFNLPGVAVIMPYDHTNDSFLSYGVDVVFGSVFTPKVDFDRMLNLNWSATHQLGDQALQQKMETQMKRILSIASYRSFSLELNRIIEEVLGAGGEGNVITSEDIDRLSTKIAEFYVDQASKS